MLEEASHSLHIELVRRSSSPSLFTLTFSASHFLRTGAYIYVQRGQDLLPIRKLVATIALGIASIMSAAFYLRSSNHTKNEEEVVDIDKSMPPASEAHHSWKPEVAVKPSKGRKAGKLSSSQQQGIKKQPQRALGVAHLEKLRLEERWKKMTQISEHPAGVDAGTDQLHLPLLDIHKTRHGGYNGDTIGEAYPNIWASAWVGGAGHSHPPRQVNPGVKTEEELSSTQNMASFSYTFDHQYIEKKWSDNDVLMGVMRHMGTSSSGVVGGESSGLGWGGSGAGRNVHEEMSCVHGFGASSILYVPSFGLHVPSSATKDIGAFQRMESTSTTQPMEYDFFPHKLGDIGLSSPETMAHEPSTICEGVSSSPTSSPATFIDLSLKLSCY